MHDAKIEEVIQCPRCLGSIDAPKMVIVQKRYCARCGAELQIAPLYARVLSVLSLLVGVGLLLAFHVGPFKIFVFAIPMWLLVLWVIVRVAPRIVFPRLEVRDSGSITTLGITTRTEEKIGLPTRPENISGKL